MTPETIKDLLAIPIATFLIRILLAILVWLITGVVRRRIGGLVAFLIRQSSRLFSRFTPNAAEINDRLTAALLSPARLIVLTVGLWIIVLILEPPAETMLFLGRVRDVLVLIALLWAASRLLTVGVTYTRTRPGRPNALSDNVLFFGQQLLQAVIWIIGIAMILSQFGYDITALVAGLGLSGLAIALAAQDLIANLIGYFVIITDAPFRVGDFIVSEKGQGFVESINFRSLRLRSPDRPQLIIPNKEIVSNAITNWARASQLTPNGMHGFNLDLHLDLATTPELIVAVVDDIYAMLEANDLSKNESVLVNLAEISESALVVKAMADFNVPDWRDFQKTRQEVNLSILEILRKHRVDLSKTATSIQVRR